MGHLISISENIWLPKQSGELHATADADFDRDASRLQVKLECFAWGPGFKIYGDRSPVDWLPHSTLVTRSVSREEATQLAQEIFSGWVRKVRRKIAQAPQYVSDGKEQSSRDAADLREPAFSMSRNRE